VLALLGTLPAERAQDRVVETAAGREVFRSQINVIDESADVILHAAQLSIRAVISQGRSARSIRPAGGTSQAIRATPTRILVWFLAGGRIAPGVGSKNGGKVATLLGGAGVGRLRVVHLGRRWRRWFGWVRRVRRFGAHDHARNHLLRIIRFVCTRAHRRGRAGGCPGGVAYSVGRRDARHAVRAARRYLAGPAGSR